MKKVKALVLFSGGLDSIITSLVLKEQGIDVTAFYVVNGFSKNDKVDYVRTAAEKIEIDFIVIERKQEFYEMWKDPKHGYGSAVNPCVDCHAMFINFAQEYADDNGFDFLATGEVLGQRGFSQSSSQLDKVIKMLNKPEKVLRPLSGKLLPETEMVKSGMVSADVLFDITGKSRNMQYKLLKKFGLERDEVESPAGGCLMTEGSTLNNVNGLIDFDFMNLDDFELIKYGRHIDLKEFDTRLVLTRTKEEMDILKHKSYDDFILVTPNILRAPTGFVQCTGESIKYSLYVSEDPTMVENLLPLLKEVHKRMLKYASVRDGETFQITYHHPDGPITYPVN